MDPESDTGTFFGAIFSLCNGADNYATSVADPGFDAFLSHGSGINFFRITDPAPFVVKFFYIIFRILYETGLRL
jgi:hypothetical protein